MFFTAYRVRINYGLDHSVTKLVFQTFIRAHPRPEIFLATLLRTQAIAIIITSSKHRIYTAPFIGSPLVNIETYYINEVQTSVSLQLYWLICRKIGIYLHN